MTWVGPRPDVSGYADQLKGEDRIILTVKPGITGLASLKYRNEEQLLAQQSNPLQYNDEVIWPDKVRINKWYVQNRSWKLDLKIILHTLFMFSLDVDQYIQNAALKRKGSPKGTSFLIEEDSLVFVLTMNKFYYSKKFAPTRAKRGFFL